METGKPQSSSALLYGSVAVPTERKMDARAPLTAVYIQAVPAPPPPQQLFPQAQFPANPQRAPAALRLAVPPLHTKDTLPFLTVHIACGLRPLGQELGLPTAIPLAPLASAAPVARPKSAGKHVCPHCSRDCMKPSVLEKHLRCHTGERPYPCVTCRVSFKTQSNLYKHKRTQAHARLSSESEQSGGGSSSSSAGSQDSAFGSSLCGSSLDSQVEEESGSPEEEEAFPVAERSCTEPGPNPGTGPERGPAGDRVQGRADSSCAKQKTETTHVPGVTKEEAPGKESETKKRQSVTPARHLPLQRQEATLVFKEWEGPAARGKPQSLESTDSGFSESGDYHMDPPPERAAQAAAEPAGHGGPGQNGPGQNGPGPRGDGVSAREQRSLEERISKLISENSAVVNDRQLETMRPRKTMLSKQGSIDLPMPYTYKDSFHFDMRNNLPPVARLHGNRRPVLQGSLQPPGVAGTEQAPLTRSSSLPHSVALLAPEQSGRGASHPRDCVTQIRRGSSGPVHPTAFPGKSVDQQVPAHHPLVRQTAVDCNHATDGPFCARASAERPPINAELSCDGGGGGGGGGDICGEPSDRKRPRKKSQKFTYNKWYAYKGGTFKKLYSTAKGASPAGEGASPAGEEPSPSRPDRPSAVQSGRSLPAGHGDGTRAACSAADGVTDVCRASCLPALPSTGPGVESSPKARVVHPAGSSPQPPAVSHVSLSTLHVTSNKSPENHSSTYIMGRPAERPAGKEKHADSLARSQRAHIPSDRKKQRTNDISAVNPSGTEADRSTPGEPSSSVAGVSPTRHTNVCQASVRSNQRADQHGEGPPAQRVNLLSSIKPSFLPKYQLKLPTATETRSTPSLRALKMSERTEDHIFTSASSSDNQRLPAVGDATPSGNECAPQPRVLSGCQSTEGRTPAQTVNQRESLVTGVTPTGAPALAASQRHCTTITTATGTMRSRHTELRSPTRIRASTVTSVAAPRAECLSRPALQGPPVTTLSTGRRNSQSPFGPSSPGALSGFSPGQSASHPHPARALPSPGPVSRRSPAPAGHAVPDLPFQMLPFEAGQLDPVQKVFHVQTADLQICLQIISDEQLALIEPRMEKQAATSQKPPQTTALNSTAPSDGAREKMAHQSTCDQREMNNMAPPPSPDPQCTMLNSMGQEDVSQVLLSGNTNVSWSLQPPIHTNSDSNHNTAAADVAGHCPGCTVPTEALPKAARPDAGKTKGECDRSFSTGFAAKEAGDPTPHVPRELLQEGSHGYQHTPLGQRLTTCTTEGVTAELHEGVRTPAASRVNDQGRPPRAQTHAETGRVVHRPGDGSLPFPDVDDKLCGASAEVNAGPAAGGGGGDEGGDRADPGPGHSDTRLQTLRRIDPGRGLDVPLIQSSSSRRTAAVADPGSDAPAGLAPPPPSGPPRGGSMLVGGPASLKAPECHGCWSSPRQPDSVGPGPAPSGQDPWEKDQRSVEEAAEHTRLGACSAADLPALPPFHAEHGAASGPAASPTDGPCAVCPPAPPADGDDLVVLPQTATRGGVDRHGQGQTLDRSPGSRPRVVRSGPDGRRDACRGVTDPPPRVEAGRPAPWDPPASTWEAVTAVIRTALAHGSETLLEPSLSPVPDAAPPRSGRYAHAAGGAAAPGEGGAAHGTRHTAYCGDPLGGGAGGGFPSGLYHHHHLHHLHHHHHHLHHHQGEEEEGGSAVFSDAQLGGHQFVEGPAAAHAWPLLPSCQGNQEESSSDDDDEGKLIIEL